MSCAHTETTAFGTYGPADISSTYGTWQATSDAGLFKFT